MSGIHGVFSVALDTVPEVVMRRMAAGLRARGSDRSATWSTAGAGLAVTRSAWELEDGLSGNALVVMDGDLVVAADASLYYQQELRDKLARQDVGIRGTTPSHLILAAYRAWNDRCVEHLEGDYAFILYDRRARRVFCARDYGGTRPLYYADRGGRLLVASTMSALLAHPECPDELNLVFLAETAGLLWASSHETAYRAIALVPAGWSLLWSGGASASLRQGRSLPEVESGPGLPFAEAAHELRRLLCRAVDERLARRGVSAVWMSGGWDSTAVFGAGQTVLHDRRSARALRPVSISYPPGDPGREDELITAIAEQWNVPIHWLDIRDIPLVDHPVERAAARDEPFAQAYEIWNRALARGARAVGARVAFDGNGGDQLFRTSPVYLADLLRRGRWFALAREWRTSPLHGVRGFLQWAVKPALGPQLLRIATILRGGKRLHGCYERWMPAWIAPRLQGLLAERQRHHLPSRQGKSCSAYETHFYLTCASFSRAGSCIAGYALEEGIELRSPLFDRRVIDFAVRRPWWERGSTGETKRLLRRAVQGLLPDRVLAPRPFRTGVTTKYFERETRKSFADLFLGASRPWVLAELGIIERDSLLRACQQYLRAPDPDVGMALLYTLHVEHWLGARVRRSNRAHEGIEREQPTARNSFAALGHG